ncbi:uncharacterized protein LOC122026664 [Zingiber officinale]|uniref:uncharacterized protein LOC122026664 n=1 Tax=Zingiber officinale TaxID=94328 RepID=UPI001C4CC839|nr:uncharacterized protein LOC122026664 [Zingiber officinale]
MVERIKEAQATDQHLQFLCSRITPKQQIGFSCDGNGILYFRGRLCVPELPSLKEDLLQEAHRSRFAIHPGGTHMYRDLRRSYWWAGMKKDIADFVARCLVCQQVKAEHQRPAGLLQKIQISEWKWEHITMDFVVGLPRTRRTHDTIWVIVDRLTKSAHFLPIRRTESLDRLAELYCREIIRLHGVPLSIISDRDPRFTSRFWQSLQQAMGTELRFITAFHPQTDEHVDLPSYGWKLGKHRFWGHRVFSVMQRWFVPSGAGVKRFGLKGKLAPRYIGPFQILERIGEVAYRLVLPPSLTGVHDVFHVSMLRRYVPHPSHILTDVSVVLQPDISYEEIPVQILDRKERRLRNKTIRLVKVGWRHHSDEEATWESEDRMRASYPHLFTEGE